MRERKMTAYKCGTCHKLGHNSRTCGTTQSVSREELPPHIAKRAERGTVRAEGELTSVQRAYGSLIGLPPTHLKQREVSLTLEECCDLIGIQSEEGESFNIIEVSAAKIEQVSHEGDRKARKKLLHYIDMKDETHELEEVQKQSYPSTQVGDVENDMRKKLVLVLRDEKNKRYVTATFTGDGYLHSFNGNPTTIRRTSSGSELRQWFKEGLLHNLHGPAVIEGGDENWWLEGEFSLNNVLCEKATSSSTTEEELFQLCQNDDFVVRQLAAANPNSPKEWAVVAELYSNNQAPVISSF